jgi:hypothetical protein
MAERNYIDVLVRILNAAKFQSDAKKESAAVKDVGDKAEQTGRKAGASLKQMVKWAASAYVFRRAAGYLKGAVDESVNLAKASVQLGRLTGLDVKESSEWVTVAHLRGVESNRLGIMFTQLGRTQQRAIAGSKAQRLAFQQVGISIQDLRSLNATELVERIADAFAQMPNGLQKAALAQQFFGRTGRQLLPMLNEGSASLQEQLDMVEKYGAALEGKTAADVLKMIKQQRELKVAQIGVKEQLADALIPTLLALSSLLQTLLKVFGPVLHNQTVMRVVLLSLVIAWVAYTAATIAATLATVGVSAVMAVSVVGAIVLVAAAIVMLIEHWAEVKAAVRDTINWISDHWRLLAVILGGPIGAAIVLIAGHFDTLKAAALDVFHAIVAAVQWAARRIHNAVSAIKAPIGWVADKVGTIAGVARSAAGAVPFMAAGGTIASSGVAVVGEKGPELVYLPRSAQVAPMDLDRQASDSGSGWRNLHVEIPVVMDGKELTRLVWKNTSDQAARR